MWDPYNFSSPIVYFFKLPIFSGLNTATLWIPSLLQLLRTTLFSNNLYIFVFTYFANLLWFLQLFLLWILNCNNSNFFSFSLCRPIRNDLVAFLIRLIILFAINITIFHLIFLLYSFSNNFRLFAMLLFPPFFIFTFDRSVFSFLSRALSVFFVPFRLWVFYIFFPYHLGLFFLIFRFFFILFFSLPIFWVWLFIFTTPKLILILSTLIFKGLLFLLLTLFLNRFYFLRLLFINLCVLSFPVWYFFVSKLFKNLIFILQFILSQSKSFH